MKKDEPYLPPWIPEDWPLEQRQAKEIECLKYSLDGFRDQCNIVEERMKRSFAAQEKLEERNENQFQRISELEDKIAKSGILLERILSEQVSKPDRHWNIIPHENGIRIKFPQPTQILEVGTEAIRTLVGILNQTLRRQLNRYTALQA